MADNSKDTQAADSTANAGVRPSIVHHLSMPSKPTYQSPERHHRRAPSYHREVKETLNARSEFTNSQDDGKSQHFINQYIIKEEIGRGSFGAVHLAVDQYGQEYAVKEFSKSRLRKRAQSNILRRPQPNFRRPGHLAAGLGFNAPLHRHSSSDVSDVGDAQNPLYLIKEEIAIMKKLNHPNLVQLIEVLDDPTEDSLYMVLEYCKKGVIMKVGLDEQADPYDEEDCRCWFRDLILGIEYLHAQGVVHRDIKPDNLLLTEDNVLKVVDFGVSEMFEKQSEMMTAKSAGSPAFLPPELCVAKHGDISGKAADIWSMGVSLYCLRYGRIPFEKTGVLELYEAIKKDDINLQPCNDHNWVELMRRILEKDPKKRITMKELRNHPWVTRDGTDTLLSEEENTAELVEPPTEREVNHAITTSMKNLLTVMKAANKFKSLLWRRRPELMSGSILGQGARYVQPPLQLESPGDLHKSKSLDVYDRKAFGHASACTDDKRSSKPEESADSQSNLRKVDKGVASPPPRTQSAGEKGHAHDPMDHELLWLGIGPGLEQSTPPETPTCAESPTAAEFNIYDTAYQLEVERIREAKGRKATVYLTRRVDGKKEYQEDAYMVDAPKEHEIEGAPHKGFKSVLDAAREKERSVRKAIEEGGHVHGLSAAAQSLGEKAVQQGQEVLGEERARSMAGVVNRAMEKMTGKSEQ